MIKKNQNNPQPNYSAWLFFGQGTLFFVVFGFMLNSWIDNKVDKEIRNSKLKWEKQLELQRKQSIVSLEKFNDAASKMSEFPLLVTRIENDLFEIKKFLHINSDGSVDMKYVRNDEGKKYYHLIIKLIRDIRSIYHPFEYLDASGAFIFQTKVNEDIYKEIDRGFEDIEAFQEKTLDIEIKESKLSLISLRHDIGQFKLHFLE